LAKIEEFKNDNGVSSGKKVKRAEKIAKAPKAAKTARKRARITQEMVEQMKTDSIAGLTAAEIAKKLGVSAATFNGYKAKNFVFDPKPKGRKKKE
jgi:DNA invertase Pin-like site-specific DNA recombinase